MTFQLGKMIFRFKQKEDIRMAKAQKVILVDKQNSENEMVFDSISKAADFIEISKMQLSRILKHQSENNTDYFITFG